MRSLAALTVLLVLWLLLSMPVAAAGEGIVEGRVINGSQGGGPVGDLEVTLRIDSASGGELRARTDPLGHFRFEGLSTSGDDVYTLAVRYQGVDYTIAGVQMDARSPSQRVEIHVYETTTSAEAVTVPLDHQIVTARPDERRLQVVNYLEVANRGDRTVVPAEAGETLGPPLPEGAENVQFLGALSEAGALLDGRLSNLNQAIPPGEHALLFAYELPYGEDSFVFRKSLDYPTVKAVFLMSAEDAEAESQQLPARKEADTAAGAHQIPTGEGLAAGTVLEVTLTGLPMGGGTSLQGVLAPAAVILAILGLGAVVAYARFRRRRVPAWGSEE